MLPLLMLLWVNLHPGFIAGLLILGVWCAGEGGTSLDGKPQGKNEVNIRTGRFGLPSSDLLAWLPHSPTRTTFSFISTSSRTSFHRRLSPHRSRSGCLRTFTILACTGLNCCCLWVLQRASGTASGDVLRGAHCVLGWMHLALVSVRNVPIFAIICAAPVASLMDHGMRECGFAVRFQAAEEVVGFDALAGWERSCATELLVRS